MGDSVVLTKIVHGALLFMASGVANAVGGWVASKTWHQAKGEPMDKGPSQIINFSFLAVWLIVIDTYTVYMEELTIIGVGLAVGVGGLLGWKMGREMHDKKLEE